MARFRFFHISDFHFCGQENRYSILDSHLSPLKALEGYLFKSHNPFYPSSYSMDLARHVARFLVGNRNNYDAVLITGDLATTGLDSDLRVAKSFICEKPILNWLAEDNRPTINSLKENIHLLPGNHDRYMNRFGAPGCKRFDELFCDYWPHGKYVHNIVISKGRDSAAIVSADFSLKKKGEKISNKYSNLKKLNPNEFIKRYGQGFVYKERLKELVKRTTYLRSLSNKYPNLVVVWAVHFPPGLNSIGRSMELVDGEKLLQSAKDNGVEIILSGHLHNPEVYRHSTVNVLCAGSATSVSIDESNYIHQLELDVSDAKIDQILYRNYIWKRNERYQFIRHYWKLNAGFECDR